ncbi:MAG TPA: pilus assembly protein TadG-related protein [Polyangia bacterium]|nr:pilus assembly protein TadG-related protein [Polyangia bacterium]
MQRTPKRHPERGAIAVLMALCLTILLGFAALGFDLAYVRLARLEMENATDAAAHAAMVVLRATDSVSQAQTAAINIAHMHEVLGQPMKLSASDITFGSYYFSTNTFDPAGTYYNAVKINSQRFDSDTGGALVNLTFGRALGYTEADVTQSVTTAFQSRFFQIELDITDSYLCYIDNAADAAVSFLDYLGLPTDPHGTQGDMVGLDVFAGITQPVTTMKNVFANYATIRDDSSKTHGSWLRDTTTLDPTQNRGIGVCSKKNVTATQCYNGATWSLTANEGGYRQCAPNALNPPPYAACNNTFTTQFAYPNHTWMPQCSAAKAEVTNLQLYAGTDLAEAIRVGHATLKNLGLSDEPHALILVTDGYPMVCTGVGGGGLCGTWNSATGADWQPCCAGGLTCGASFTAPDNNTYGGNAAGWGDGNPNAGDSGQIKNGATATGGTACTEAQQMVKDTVTEANLAAADNIDLFVIGFYNPNSPGDKFAKTLSRNHGTVFTTNDTTTFAQALKQIPSQVPFAIVH